MTEQELIAENKALKDLLSRTLIIYSHKSVDIRNQKNSVLSTELKKEIRAILNEQS
jgi:hypothetical protein